MVATKKAKLNGHEEISHEVQKFIEYLKICTVHPHPDYKTCHIWLLDYLQDIGLEVVIDKEFVADNPIIIAKYPGMDNHAPAILLNSHTDVVPCEHDKWNYDPFGAHVTDDGKIYGRGTQDMKCVGIQHLEVLRRFKRANFLPKRNIFISFVPDEELGGHKGMAELCKSDEFKALNIGLALDEGLAREDDDMTIFYGERHVFWADVKFKGNPGHGSRFIANTAVEKLRYLMNKALDYRAEQEKLMTKGTCMSLGEVTTVNVTMLSGGVQPNVVPSECKITLDCRVSHEYTFHEFKSKLESWIEESGGGEVTYLQLANNSTNSSTCNDDPWWTAITNACKLHNINLQPEIFPAGTDSRYLRQIGIPAYGFSPINNTPILLHDHNEWLGRDIFMKGIDILESVIKSVGNA